MKLIILGSGGFQTIPRPCCQCKICTEARIKGIPYSRSGPSLFIKDIKTIFDTPKDIINSVNRENLIHIENIFYTHWHPDHTEGMRFVEEITSDWSKKQPYRLENHGEPINIFAPEETLKEIKSIQSPLGSYFDYFESKNFIKTCPLEFDKEYKFNKISITPIKLDSNKTITPTAYLIKEKNKKIIYMPCELKPFKIYDLLQDTDLFIIGSPFLESKNGIKNIPEDHPIRNELFSIEEIIDLIKKYNIKKTVIVHIEEMWGLSYDEYKKLEKRYKQYRITFAYDGLKIDI